MNIPFTVEQFLGVFRSYNLEVWPAQILLVILAVVCIVLAIRGGRRNGPVISAILALLWLWMGLVYHIGYFSAINPAATLFGLLFVVQGLLFVYYGVVRNDLVFSTENTRTSNAGLMLIAYALVIYPLIGLFTGHIYPESPTFGLPCPTTIFTLAMLLVTVAPMPRLLLVVPLIWAAIGAVAALQLGVYQDLGLPVAGIVSLVLLWRRDRHHSGRTDVGSTNVGGWSGRPRIR